MKHMSEVGIRALKQAASQVVASAVAGERIVITDRGRPVAVLAALPASPLEELIASGRARPPRHSIADLAPAAVAGSASDELARMRDAERY